MMENSPTSYAEFHTTNPDLNLPRLQVCIEYVQYCAKILSTLPSQSVTGPNKLEKIYLQRHPPDLLKIHFFYPSDLDAED